MRRKMKMKREKKTNNSHFSSRYTFMYNVVNILMPYQPHILPTCLILTEHSRCNTACNSLQYHRPSIEILHHPCPAPPNEKPLLLSGELLLTIWLAGAADVGGLHSWIERGGGDAGWCVVVITQCQHSTHSPPHEQLLEELGVGGVPSASSLIATTHPPCKQTLAAVVVVLVAVVVVLSVVHHRCR